MNSFLVFGLVAMATGCDIHLPASTQAALEEMTGEASVEEAVESAIDAAEDGLVEYARCEQICLKGAECESLSAGVHYDSCIAECTARGLAGDADMEATILCVEDANSCEAVEACHEPGPDACVHGEVSNRKGQTCACIGGHWDCVAPRVEEHAPETESSPVTVSDCAVACDAVEACAPEASEPCFAVCLNESSDDEIRDSVHCVLAAQSCEQVVNCAGPLASHHVPSPQEEMQCEFGHQVMHEDGVVCACTEDGLWDCGDSPAGEPVDEPADAPADEPIEDTEASQEAPSCSICNPVEACGFVPPGHCDEVCGPDMEIPVELVDCLQAATHCEEILFCLQEMEQPDEVEASGECVPGEMSEDGCLCEEASVWNCDVSEEASPQPNTLKDDCSVICEKVAECNGIPHEMCLPLCVSQFAQTGIAPCFLKAESCDELDACSNPAVNEDVAECEPGEVDGEGCFCKDDGHWTCGVPAPGAECSPEFPCEDMGNQSDEEYEFEGQKEDQDQDEFEGSEFDEFEGKDQSDPCQEEGVDCTGAPLDPMGSVGCADVDIDRELMVTDLSVVEDPERTFDGCVGNPMGAWTFGSLMTHMAGDNDPAAFTLNWLEQWTMDQELNGFVSPARLSIEEQVIQPWMARSGGESLDMAKSPFRLLAIVNRLDLRKTDSAGEFHAGEGRFVFGLVDVEAGCMPLEFVVIFEYGQRAESVEEIQDWAHAWHGLSANEFGPDYNASLEAVTTAFVGPGADPSKPNGSSINQIRTNEIVLDGPWELREFRVQLDGQLAQVSVKQEPGDALKNDPELAEWINDNEADVLASTHVVPAEMLGPAAAVTGLWAPEGVNNPDARHNFALNTCSGCHQAETGAPFLHVGSRFPGEETPLSAFLVGGETMDPVSGTIRSFNDLERRMFDLCELVDEETTDEAVHDVDVAPACSAG